MRGINISSNHLKPVHLPDLLMNLRRFPLLERVTISDNPDMRFLSFEFMQFVSQLKHFDCDNCSLVIPPQRIFTVPGCNPSIVDGFIKSANIDISSLQLLPIMTTDVASILENFSALRHVTLSGNPSLQDQGVASIMSSLSGTSRSLAISALMHMMLLR